jgi:hypothetical protein
MYNIVTGSGELTLMSTDADTYTQFGRSFYYVYTVRDSTGVENVAVIQHKDTK